MFVFSVVSRYPFLMFVVSVSSECPFLMPIITAVYQCQVSVTILDVHGTCSDCQLLLLDAILSYYKTLNAYLQNAPPPNLSECHLSSECPASVQPPSQCPPSECPPSDMKELLVAAQSRLALAFFSTRSTQSLSPFPNIKHVVHSHKMGNICCPSTKKKKKSFVRGNMQHTAFIHIHKTYAVTT